MNFLVRTIAIAQNAILPSHWKPKKLQKSTILYDITVLLSFIFTAFFFHDQMPLHLRGIHKFFNSSLS